MIIFNQKERCAAWAFDRIPAMRHVGIWKDFEALGWEKRGELQAAVIFNLYSGADIAMHVAAIPGGRWLTKEFLFAAFAYPFLQLGCRRVSGYVPSKCRDVIAFDEHLGFTYEGTMRDALPDDDIVCLGMLRADCRFIRKVELQKAA
jgi:RimJ/RimL family protein N-acetyltransferase